MVPEFPPTNLFPVSVDAWNNAVKVWQVCRHSPFTVDLMVTITGVPHRLIRIVNMKNGGVVQRVQRDTWNQPTKWEFSPAFRDYMKKHERQDPVVQAGAEAEA